MADNSGMNGKVVREVEMPNFGFDAGLMENELAKNYVVKYYKGCLDDLEQLAFIEDIETRSLEGKDILLVDSKMSFFQDTVIVVLNYYQRKPKV